MIGIARAAEGATTRFFAHPWPHRHDEHGWTEIEELQLEGAPPAGSR